MPGCSRTALPQLTSSAKRACPSIGRQLCIGRQLWTNARSPRITSCLGGPVVGVTASEQPRLDQRRKG
eukprot:scaffold664_cov129-Isochrysis_galbana.AAC.12